MGCTQRHAGGLQGQWSPIVDEVEAGYCSLHLKFLRDSRLLTQ